MSTARAPLKPCAQPSCGKLVPTGTARCAAHLLPDTRPTRQARGYTNDWLRLVAQAIREQPWCSVCGGTEDLTGDHIVPRSRGGSSTRENLRVLCRGCNSRKGDR